MAYALFLDAAFTGMTCKDNQTFQRVRAGDLIALRTAFGCLSGAALAAILSGRSKANDTGIRRK